MSKAKEQLGQPRRGAVLRAPLAASAVWLLFASHFGCGDKFSSCEDTRSCPQPTGGTAGESSNGPGGNSSGGADFIAGTSGEGGSGGNSQDGGNAEGSATQNSGENGGSSQDGGSAGGSPTQNSGGNGGNSQDGGSAGGSPTQNSGGARLGTGGQITSVQGGTPNTGGRTTSNAAGRAGNAAGAGGRAPVPRCGDGHIDEHESCDDGNVVPGDGCSSTCRSEAIDLQLGEAFACAVLGDGRLKCWGQSDRGQLGNGESRAVGDEPGEMGPQLAVTLTGVTQLATGRAHACAVSRSRVYCWGDNSRGQLGLAVASETPIFAPAPVEFALGADVRAMSASGDFTCALLVNGSVKCWGDNTYGVLGVDTSNAYEPFVRGQSLRALDLGENAISVSAGRDFACAALQSGKVKCWGSNRRGSLGLGVTEATLPYASTPTNAVDLGPNFSASSVAVGTHACALASAGLLKCWGNASAGLGYENNVSLGTDPSQLGVMLPPVPLSSPVQQAAVGWFETCVVLTTGNVECFGGGKAGMLGRPDYGGSGATTNLGDNAGEMSSLAPLPLGGKVRLTRIGRDDVCALLTNGEVKCWGSNRAGQLGHGDTLNQGDDVGEMEKLPATPLD